MPHVVAEPCIGCKHQQCAVVCPCECFYQDERMLYIDAESCIDCDACAAECPGSAIFRDDHVPEKWSYFIQLNAERVGELRLVKGAHVV